MVRHPSGDDDASFVVGLTAVDLAVLRPMRTIAAAFALAC
jgi:hypothetical protein